MLALVIDKLLTRLTNFCALVRGISGRVSNVRDSDVGRLQFDTTGLLRRSNAIKKRYLVGLCE